MLDKIIFKMFAGVENRMTKYAKARSIHFILSLINSFTVYLVDMNFMISIMVWTYCILKNAQTASRDMQTVAEINAGNKIVSSVISSRFHQSHRATDKHLVGLHCNVM